MPWARPSRNATLTSAPIADERTTCPIPDARATSSTFPAHSPITSARGTTRKTLSAPRMAVASEPGRGSTFAFFLPFEGPPPVRDAAVHSPVLTVEG